MASILIYISSDDRTVESSSTSDFTVNFGNNNKLSRITSYYIKSMSIPNVSYNLYEASPQNGVPANNVFTYSSGSITVTPGYYNINQLITAITTDAIAIADGMAITVSPITGKLIFTTTNPVSYFNTNGGNLMGNLLGIFTSSVAPGLSFTASGLPDLSGINNIFVRSVSLSGQSAQMIQGKESKPYIVDIPINEVEYGSYYNYETQHYEIDQIIGSLYFNLGTIDIQLFDTLNRIIDLHGLQFNITLRAYYDP